MNRAPPAAPGRGPVTPTGVDQILDNPTRVRYSPPTSLHPESGSIRVWGPGGSAIIGADNPDFVIIVIGDK